MNDRRSGDQGWTLVGSWTWRVVVASVLWAAVAHAQTVDSSSAGGAARVLAPQRLGRTVPLVDGYDLQFRRVGTGELSQTRVAQIVQDEQGFMWFGTQRGLYRYDGQALRVFRNVTSHKNSLSGVYVYSLLKGRANTLWVGSDGFLDSYDARRETFQQHGITAAGEPPRPMNISCMSEDASGMLWLCTRGGLYRIDPRTQQGKVLRHRPGDPSSLSGDAIQFVGEDRQGVLWVGTEAGLDLLDPSSGTVQGHLPLPGSRRGMSVHEDRFGVVWIVHGEDGQLAVFDRAANTLATWRPSSRATDADPVRFSALLEDRDGTMWFGTLNHGVLKFERNESRFVRYTSDPLNPHGVSDRRVNVLYQDREGLIWTGLHQSEPNYFLPRAPSFQSIAVAGRQSTLVSAILEDRAGLVWLGLDLGVRTVDRQARAYRNVPALEGKETTSIVESAPGVFWIGTAGQGLWHFDQRTGRVRNFRHDPQRRTSLPSDFVEQVKRDSEGAVWAVTWRGLARWEPGSEQFVTMMPTDAPPELTLHTATFARNGVVWIGSNLGVHRYDPAAQSFQWFRHDKGDATSLSNDRVNSIYEASDASIWIATQIGLDHWDGSGKPLRRYSQADGLPGTAVSCVLEDDDRQYWLSTDRGISRLNATSGEFKPYGTADGIPGTNMTGWNACVRTSSGEMLFAGFAGAVSFVPRNVVDRQYPLPVVLTHFQLLDATFDEGGRQVSYVPLGHTSDITLQPSQGKFSVGFAALSFLSPETNRIRYRLQPLQEEWSEVYGEQRVATYMALPPGSYSFEVQGASGHGPWTPSATTLRIVMLPPWWKSNLFYVLASVVVVATLFTAYRIRVRQLTQAYIVRHEVRWAERTRIARELHDTLLQGFQGLMFRLQAVRDLLPAQPAKAIPVLDTALLMGEAAIDDARTAVSDLRSSGKVDENLNAGLSTLAATAAHASHEEKVASWELVSNGQVREVPRTVLYELYRVAQEAISNAFRHARADHVTIDVRYGADRLRITVTDDGIGFDEALLSSERNAGHFGVQGMKERIERLGGEVKLRTRPREGTRVAFSVPAAVAYRTESSPGGLGSMLRWQGSTPTRDRDA